MPSLDDTLERFGGRWVPGRDTELSRVVEANTRRIRRIQEANFSTRRPPMEFVLVNNGAFNAFATVHEQTDVIAMNLGLLLVLNNLFLAIMSHPEVLPKVGDATAEKAKLYNVEQFNVDIIEASQLAPSLYPNDPVRKDYALKLSWIARNFILEHEFCHIFNGHVDWLNDKSNITAFDEIEIASVPALSSLNRQTLEMDADCYGASHTLLSIFRGDPSKVLANPFMNTTADALYAIHFALYATFRIFHNKPFNEIDSLLGKGNHPPAVLRQYIALAALASRIDSHPDVRSRVSSQEGIEIGGRAMRGVEAAFLFLKGREWDPKGALSNERFPEGLIPACTDAANTLESNWKVLRSGLEPFKRGKELAE